MTQSPSQPLRQRAAFLEGVLQSLVDPVFVLDYDGCYLDAFGASERRQYDSLQYVIGRTLHEVMPAEVADGFLADIRRVLDTGEVHVNEYPLAADDCEGNPKDGPAGLQWFQGRIAPLQDDGSGLRAVAWVVVNISERKRLEAELKRLADCDELTGLPNRRACLAWLGELFAGPPGERRRSAQFALLDLDHFKRVNDRYGHLVGDELLRHVARLLTDSVGPNARVARIGGEEFAVLLEGEGLEDAVARLDALRARLIAEPMALGTERIACDVSAGVCAVGAEDRHPVDLLRRADALLYQAKEAGRGRVVHPGWRERRSPG